MSDDEIVRALRLPHGQRAIREAAVGARRPVVLVDDLTRPTPAARVLPFLLAEFAAAGVPASAVTVVLATGTHGPPAAAGAFDKKIGSDAASQCRLSVHDHRADCVRLGHTSFGTPVLVNRVVADSDFVVGVGGVYPQHTSFFGGGSKLVLGALAERSIATLHYRHWHPTGRYELENDFRRDLDEVASMAGLRTSITIHVDAFRRPVRVAAGDPRLFYADQARFSRETFLAPPPGDADVVIANAYPMDLSLTFAQSKGSVPLREAARHASRVLIAACPEGNGRHGLFPLVDVPRHHYKVQWFRRQLMNRSALPGKVRSRLKSSLRGPAGTGATLMTEGVPQPIERHPIHLYRPFGVEPPIDAGPAGFTETSSWSDALSLVEREQRNRERIRAVVYPCAPLQTLGVPDSTSSSHFLHGGVELGGRF